MAVDRPARAAVIAMTLVVAAALLTVPRVAPARALGPVVPLAVAILWVILLALASWGLGAPLWRRLAGPIGRGGEDLLLASVLGTAALAAAAGLLGALHLLHRPLLLGVLALAASLGAIRIHRHGLPLAAGSSPPSWPWLPLGLAGALSLAAATTVAPFYDQWHYHLALPGWWLRTGSVHVQPLHAYSYLPANMSLLFAYALAGPGAWAAQVTSWWTGALAAGGAAALARRLGGGGVLAAALFVATPATIQVGALAASDLGVAAFTVAAVLVLLRAVADPSAFVRLTAVAGGLAGVAAGCKVLALGTVVAPLGVVAVAAAMVTTPRGATRRAVAAAAALAAAAVATLGPWLVRNAALTGNPLHPYLSGLPGAAGGAGSASVAASIGSIGLTAESVRTASTLGAFSSAGHAGDVGIVFLVLAPAALLALVLPERRRQRAVTAAVAGLGLVAFALAPPLGRYLLPILALVAALEAAAWTRLVAPLTRALRVALTVLLGALLLANCNPSRTEYLTGQLQVFVGASGERDQLDRLSSQLPAVRAANRLLPADATVLLVGESRSFGLDRDVVVQDPFSRPLLVRLAEESASAEEMAGRLRSLGVTHLLLNHLEARRIAAAGGRERYLQCSSPAAGRRLQRFLDEHLATRWRNRWSAVMELAS